MTYDLILQGGRIIDGTGNPWYWGDLAIKDGKIAAIGTLDSSKADSVLDVKGLVVVPGFIDAHSHADRSTLYFREMKSLVMQGITTVVGGQCGGSPAPVDPSLREEMEARRAKVLPPEVDPSITWTTFDDYLRLEKESGLGTNVAHLVGHGTIRIASMGREARDPTPEELKRMRELTAEAMEAGAFGISTGLIYPPGIFAKTDEIVELAKVAARYGGVYDSHIRGEGKTLMESLEEAIAIGERAGIPVQISHHKAATKSIWGKSVESLRLLEEARERGVDVTVDQYPYRAGSTSLATCLPPWAHDGGIEKLLERLGDPDARARMRSDIEEGIPGWENFAGELGWENVMVSSVKSDENKPFEGKNLEEICEMRGDADAFATLFDLILEEEGSVSMIIFAMDEGDVRRIMGHPLQMVGTDSGASAADGFMRRGKPHPRGYGSYPKILGRYVRELGVLGLEEAVRKMTSFPAQRFGISDRGILRPGMWADVVVFDPKTVTDKATYQDPHQYPEGLEYVLVNGRIAVEKGKHTGTLAGGTLRRNQ
ncbi:MAG: D-aminoacylase [Candidatus Bathyarchaeota archaeon]|nr:MAG: D-aminoacylase [Candidatus Bathyarchaeota archaeon]